MKKCMNLFVCLLMSIACSSLPALSTRGEQAKISKDAPEKTCKEIGDVMGSAYSAYPGDHLPETVQAAKNDLKNKAAERSANYVVLETNNSSLLNKDGGSSVTLSGTAFHCPE